MFIAKLTKDTFANGKMWPAGTILTRAGEVVIFPDKMGLGYEYIPVTNLHPRFELKQSKIA